MIIKNDSNRFEVMLDGKDYTVDIGLNEFGITVGDYILKQGIAMGFNLSVVEEKKLKVGKAPLVHEPEETFICDPVEEVVNPISAMKVVLTKKLINKHNKKK